MPLVTIKCVGQKTVEQKRALVKDITEAIVKNLKAPAEAVTVDIIEYDRANFGAAGILFTDR